MNVVIENCSWSCFLPSDIQRARRWKKSKISPLWLCSIYYVNNVISDFRNKPDTHNTNCILFSGVYSEIWMPQFWISTLFYWYCDVLNHINLIKFSKYTLNNHIQKFYARDDSVKDMIFALNKERWLLPPVALSRYWFKILLIFNSLFLLPHLIII